MKDSGTYALIIASPDSLSLRIGSLGNCHFAPGYYVYVGSALGGLTSRLKRHLRKGKRLHWHIDYLLEETTIAQIWYSQGKDKFECTWNAIVKDLPGAVSALHGFGASDCRCYSHLSYFPTIPSFGIFKQKLKLSKLPQAHRLIEQNKCKER